MLEVVHDVAQAADHGGQGLRHDLGVHGGLLLDELVQAAQQGAAAGDLYSLLQHVAGQFRRGAFNDLVHGIQDGPQGLGEGGAHVVVLDEHLARQASHEIAAADRYLEAVLERQGGADGDLRKLGGWFADSQLELLAHEANDVLIEAVAGDLQRPRDDNAAHGDHGDIGRAAAYVHDEVGRRLLDRQGRAAGRGPGGGPP